MDYASDLDELGLPARRERRGGMSFMVIALGTVLIVAGWILTASDPYTELANRVVQMPGDSAAPIVTSDGTEVLLFEEAEPPAAETPVVTAGRRPASAPWLAAVSSEGRPAPHQLPGEEVVVVAPDAFVGPTLPEPEVIEAALDLDRSARRSVQRRLSISGFDAGPADGVFGPATRQAITGYQQRWGYAETGYLDAAMLASLVQRTEKEYAAWTERRSASRRRAARESAIAELTPLPAEPELPVAPGDCRRTRDGRVVGRQSLGCDLRGLGEGLRDMVTGDLSGPSGAGALEQGADVDR